MTRPLTTLLTLAAILVAAGIIFLIVSVQRSNMTGILILPLPMYGIPAVLFVTGAIFLNRGSRVASVGLAILFGFSAFGFLIVAAIPHFLTNVPLSALLWPLGVGATLLVPAITLVFSNRLRHELATIREVRRAR